MTDRDKLVVESTVLKVVNKVLDYAEELTDLSAESIDKKDKTAAGKYLYSAIVLKTLAEEILDTDYEKEPLVPYDDRLAR